MNIKFENILNLSMTQLKENWNRVFINGFILGAMIVLISISYIFVAIMISVVLVLIGGGNGVVEVITGIILFLAILLFILPLSYLSSTANFIVAKASMDDNRLIAVFKEVFTRRNISFYLVRMFIPILIVTLIYLGLGAMGVAAGGYAGLAWFVILAIPYVIVSCYFTSAFIMSLYTNTDVKLGYTEISQKYSRKQIFKAYLVQLSLMIILNIVLSVLSIIPTLGFLLNILLGTIGGAIIVQAMIISLGSNQSKVQESPSNPAQVTIESDTTVVTINSFGAQITSVVQADHEYMWQADPEVWGRTAPVLFPFVGKLKDDKYQAGGEMLPMSQHGFLRDRNFEVASQTKNSVTFEYTSTLADYEVYPVDFTVQISYQVVGSKVTTTYNVINNSSYEMPYQIGAHPGFNVESVDELTAVFKPQTVTKHYFEAALQSKTEQTQIDSIDLSYAMINDNLPCFSNFEDRHLMLQKNGEDFIKFEFTSMEYLAIWSPEFKNAKFICIEPWNGICARQDQVGYLLENKDGMNYLAAESSTSCSFSFEIC